MEVGAAEATEGARVHVVAGSVQNLVRDVDGEAGAGNLDGGSLGGRRQCDNGTDADRSRGHDVAPGGTVLQTVLTHRRKLPFEIVVGTLFVPRPSRSR